MRAAGHALIAHERAGSKMCRFYADFCERDRLGVTPGVTARCGGARTTRDAIQRTGTRSPWQREALRGQRGAPASTRMSRRAGEESQPSLAATNKYLAQSNKSRTGAKATKKRKSISAAC
jgi:hypothetical protein